MLKNCSYQVLSGSLDCMIQNIAYHSEKVAEGSVFICIQGATADGHDYVSDAVRKGAKAVICQHPVSLPMTVEAQKVTVVQVDDCRKVMALMAAAFYGNPAKELTLIGLTGTKGKTTTSYMIQSILRETGIKAGLIGTVQIDTGGETISSTHTTPESLEIHRYLREMADNGCKVAILEVSSQALMLARVYGLIFDVAVFTNIEEDHIGPGEHRDFADYVYWKSQLFSQCRKAVVNGDDPHLEQILGSCVCPVTTYGTGKSNDFICCDFSHVKLPGKLGVEFTVQGDYNIDLVVGMAGEFSCRNGTAAIAVCREFCTDREAVRKALREITVPGRQEMFAGKNGSIVMVDYAHNGTALKHLLHSIGIYHPPKLTCLFGCGGQRDRQRRFTMGEIAARYADFVIITSDNPRNEKPELIIEDITQAVDRVGGKYRVISDRREAIEYAVKNLTAGEILVIAGKGHEDYQIIGEKKIHFDDREVVLASIEKVNHERDYIN